LAVSPLSLFGPTVVGTAAAALYTVPVNTTVTVNRVVVNNVTAGAVALTLWVVRSGGTNITGNLMVGASSGGLSISAGPVEPYVVNAFAALVLNAGDSIWAQASAASALNVVGSGWSQ
jgi:hypothetical protein